MRRLLLALLASLLVACPTSEPAPTPDGGAVDASTVDAASGDAASGDAGPPTPCDTSTCGPGEICIRGRCAGCCDVPPECIPMPAGCTGAPACGCFTTDPCGGCTTCQSVTNDGILCGNCMCTCAAPWTPIDTPDGPRPIADLRAGDLVYSVDHGEVTVVPLVRVGRRPVSRHAVVRVTLAGGDVVEMSGGHPTADGHRFADLAPGGLLGAAQIASVETVPYDEPYTYDVLPASDTGTYFVGGAWIGSTLHDPGCVAEPPVAP